MEDSIFTKIVKGELPSYKVFEDETCLAFLNIKPFSKGHTLVIPKQQIEFLWDLDGPLYGHLMEITKKVALRLKTALEVPYVGLQVVGVDVPHTHVHVIPFSDSSVFHLKPDELEMADPSELKELASKLYFE
jgi:histidine triad (HIT) family protein